MQRIWIGRNVLSSPSLYLMVGDESAADELADELTSSDRDTVVRIVRGKRCRDKERLFQEFAAALQFPYYFGANWDAFDECLNDLSWLPATSIVLLVADADLVLTGQEEAFSIFTSILRDVSSEWRAGTKAAASGASASSFRAILQCAPAALQPTWERLVPPGRAGFAPSNGEAESVLAAVTDGVGAPFPIDRSGAETAQQ